MVQSVELLLDAGLDAGVRAEWAALADAGLPSQARHTGASNAPHVTLAIAASVPPDVEAAMHGLGGSMPVPLRLGGLLLFGRGERRILVRAVVPSAELLALHARAAALVDLLPGTSHQLVPGAWTPHVTLARGMPVDRLPDALRALGDVGEPAGTAVAVRRWDGDARRTWRLVG